MRYIISSDFKTEWSARAKYIYDTLKLWCALKDNGIYAEYTSLPDYALDVIFIVGHNSFVHKYLVAHKTDIKESIVVLITCNIKYNYIICAKRKKMYICNQTKSNTAELYNSSYYNFPFDATESELLFYNCPKKDIVERLNLCFTKIK